MKSQRGFTFIGLLLALTLIGIGLTAVSEVWSTTVRHQRLQQLDWVGQQFIKAIGSYYEGSPGLIKTYPKRMTDLLDDQRTGFLRRHVRNIYVDPFSGSPDWELITALDGGIQGVRSRAQAQAGSGVAAREYLYVPFGRSKT